MDAVDAANDYSDRFQNDSLSKHKKKHCIKTPQKIIDGVLVCLDCDYPISEKRLSAKPNAVRCVECQSYIESRGTS